MCALYNQDGEEDDFLVWGCEAPLRVWKLDEENGTMKQINAADEKTRDGVLRVCVWKECLFGSVGNTPPHLALTSISLVLRSDCSPIRYPGPEHPQVPGGSRNDQEHGCMEGHAVRWHDRRLTEHNCNSLVGWSATTIG